MIIEFNVDYSVFTIIAEEAKKAKRTISDEVIELIREVISQDGFNPFSTVININVTTNTNIIPFGPTISIIIKEVDMLETLIEQSNIVGFSLSNYISNLTKFIANSIRTKKIDKNYHSINPGFINPNNSTKFTNPANFLNACNLNQLNKIQPKYFDTISSIILDVFNQQHSYSINLSDVYKLPNDIILRTNDEEMFNEYKKDITNWYMLLAKFITRLVDSDIEEYSSLKDKVIKDKNLIYEFTISLSDVCSPLEYLRSKRSRDDWRVTKYKGFLSKWKLYLVYNDEKGKVDVYYPNIIRINNED